MTVRELESEMVLGQKWAVECEYTIEYEDGEVESDLRTTHYKVGSPARCPFFENKVRSIRVVHDEIYVLVTEFMRAGSGAEAPESGSGSGTGH